MLYSMGDIVDHGGTPVHWHLHTLGNVSTTSCHDCRDHTCCVWDISSWFNELELNESSQLSSEDYW